MSATLTDLLAIDGAVDGLRLYDEAPDGAQMPYLAYEPKLTRTTYAGDEVLCRTWRYDLVLWLAESDRALVSDVADWLDSHGLMGEAYHYPDRDEMAQYVVFETSITESR